MDLEERLWYAVWTRSRHEKSLSKNLENRGFEVFLPLIKSRQKWSDRWKIVEVPLFPGYALVCTTRGLLPDVKQLKSVVGMVRINGHPTPIQSDVEAAGIEPEPKKGRNRAIPQRNIHKSLRRKMLHLTKEPVLAQILCGSTTELCSKSVQ